MYFGSDTVNPDVLENDEILKYLLQTVGLPN